MESTVEYALYVRIYSHQGMCYTVFVMRGMQRLLQCYFIQFTAHSLASIIVCRLNMYCMFSMLQGMMLLV